MAVLFATLLSLVGPVAMTIGRLPCQEPLERTETWDNGNLKVRFFVDEAGKQHGTYEEWAESGTRIRLSKYVRGVQEGPHAEWSADGQRLLTCTYRGGELHGFAETFHPNGEVATSGRYAAGKRTGKWVERDAAGDRERLAEYRDGKLHGTLRIKQKGKTLTKQMWRDGDLVELDDLRPFPVPREQLLQETRTILATPMGKATDDAKAGLRHEALLRLRAYRNLCGLAQADMVLVHEWNDLCDAAAEVCRANGDIGHEPPRPPGFDEARYQQGAIGAKSSNLSRAPTLPMSVDDYMDDSDPRNIEHVGHRRWCLNPAMRRVGFGTADDFHAMWAFDASGNTPKGMTAIYYPPAGFVPVDMFASHHAFSIILLRGSAPKTQLLGASVRKLDDDYLPEGDPLPVDNCHVAEGGPDTGPCIIFRAPSIEVAPGRRYLVEVSLDGGKTQAHRYVVEFTEAAITTAK